MVNIIEDLTQRNKELLEEIASLKTPPVQENKENIITKEAVIKSLENNELGFNFSLSEKTKLDNLPLQEIESYKNQLIKISLVS